MRPNRVEGPEGAGETSLSADSWVGGQTEVGALERVLVKRPQEAFGGSGLGTEDWMALGYRHEPDAGRAIEEHAAFVELLEGFGAVVKTLPGHPDAGMDSIYTRDASIVCDGGVILCNMGKSARAAEPNCQRAYLEAEGMPLVGSITGDGRLEGGDVLWLDQDTLVVGRGYRTNAEGILQLRALAEPWAREVVEVPLPHWKGPSDVFHLMSMISPVDQTTTLVYSPLLPVPFREFLLSRGHTLVEVPHEEFDSMGCNVLAVAPGKVVMLDGNPETRKRLEKEGIEVRTYVGLQISVPGDGGPTCLTRPLLRQG
jgi:N-dimethylarginine dimethylaminohydrolase